MTTLEQWLSNDYSNRALLIKGNAYKAGGSKRANKDDKVYVGRYTTLQNLVFCFDELRSGNDSILVSLDLSRK